MKIKGWNLYEMIWLTLFSAIILILAFFWKSSVLGISVTMAPLECIGDSRRAYFSASSPFDISFLLSGRI